MSPHFPRAGSPGGPGRGSWWRALLGRPRDWVPAWDGPTALEHLPGFAIVAATFVVSAIPFLGVDGDGTGLYVGTASILAMAWSFVLAVRTRAADRAFGGLDRVYIAHRWLGIIAIVLMWWHVQSGNELDTGGEAGASDQVAELGTDLGGLAEFWLYVLVVISILRVLPWRLWRWTHKLMGIPFAFASFHMITAEKPFANLSGWGLWFLVVIGAGSAAYVVRVLGRDLVGGRRHVVSAIIPGAGSVELRLRSEGLPLVRRAGQFAFLRPRVPGAREPHPFSIASAPDDPELAFMIRELGDWTGGLGRTLRVGDRVDVEGPYGRLRLRPRDDRPVVWVAGGVGITPFLSDLDASDPGRPPVLVYAVRSRGTAHAVEAIDRAAGAGRVEVHYVESQAGPRLDESGLLDAVGERMAGAHVVVCGPAPMIRWVRRAARRAGAHTVTSEQFDLRGGVGPDPSATLLPTLRRRP